MTTARDLVLVLAIGAAACIPGGLASRDGNRDTRSDTKNTMADEPTCDETLTQLLARDFTGWRGLPVSCDHDALAARLQFGQVTNRGLVGSSLHGAVYRRAATEEYSEPLEVWYRDDRLVKIVIALPDLDDPKGLVAALGEPEAMLDYYPTTVPTPVEGGAWAWPSRGLTLFMSTRRDNVVALEVYPATAAETYRRDIFYSEPPRERPLD